MQFSIVMGFIISLWLSLASEKTAFLGLVLGGLNILILTILMALQY